MTAQDKLTIFYNTVARMGINHPQLLNEFAKTIHRVNRMGSMEEMQAQMPVAPPIPAQTPPVQPQAPEQALGAGGLSEPTQGMPQGEIMPQNA